MICRRLLLATLAAGLVASAGAQTLFTYTNTEAGEQRIPLGYPVPIPVASLTPVDGFRDYASLDARLRLLDDDSADLAGHDVGQTFNGRTVRAYVVSDADGVDVEGRPEAAFFINAGIHAREWGTPEVSTYLVERMVEGSADQGLVRYLLDNTRLVIIPVNNVDGFAQTQRFPDQALLGQDPRSSSWPRDGRMRRKNMRGVDETLQTLFDHLGGIDLNRNHPPFWGTVTNGGQLTNPNDLTFRGAAAHSEPESQALVQAAQLAPASRIRLGVDVHTFSRVFFSSNTGRSRLNSIQTRLLSVISNHHANVPTAQGGANGAFYVDIPDPPNSGIGAAAEYFAYEWLVPAWTLELEPQNSGAEYGGTGASHSGFVLPDSQVRRVREAWAESFLVSFYFMSGAPHLRAMRISDSSTGELLQEQRWERDPATGRRSLISSTLAEPAPGQALSIDLVFSKPMRYRDGSGSVASLPGLNTSSAPTVRRILGAGATESVDTQGGAWLAASGFARYRDDTYRFTYVPNIPGELRFEVETTDMVGLALDADPASPVDWQDGAWSAWEDSAGNPGDSGGADRLTAALRVSAAGNPQSVTLLDAAARAGEGDALALLLLRSAAHSDGALQLVGRVAGSDEASITYASAESGERLLRLPISDNVLQDGERSLAWEVHVAGATDGPPLLSGSVLVLDNDRAGHAVVRSAEDPRSALQTLAASGATQRDLVLDGGRSYRGPSNPLTVCQQFDMEAPLRVYGNRARLEPGSSSCSVVALGGSGAVELRDLQLSGERESGEVPVLIEGDGQSLSLQRTILRDAGSKAITGVATLQLSQSALLDMQVSQPGGGGNFAAVEVARAEIATSSLLGVGGAPDTPGALLQFTDSQESALSGISLDGFPSALIRGASSLQGSVYYEAPAPGFLPQPACQGVRSLGHNVFPTIRFSCFAAQPSDSALGLAPPARSGPDLAWQMPPAELVDAGAGCDAVDQRGAPRPQTPTSGATPRCDIGAVEQGVNPWRGFWQPARDGHGIDLQTAGNVLTLLWYTYAEDGQPTAYLASGPLTGPLWRAELLTARRDPASGAISNPVVGTVSLLFTSDVEATLGWQFGSGPAGSELVRALDFSGSEPRVEVTGSWFPPAESGNGASIARRGEVTAMALYYYDAAGTLRWALGQGSGADVSEITLSSFRGFCPDCDAVSNPVTSEVAGSALLHFRTPQHLRLDSDISYPGAAGGRWQRSGAEFIPLSDPVDNREAAAAAGR